MTIDMIAASHEATVATVSHSRRNARMTPLGTPVTADRSRSPVS